VSNKPTNKNNEIHKQYNLILTSTFDDAKAVQPVLARAKVRRFSAGSKDLQ